jgi:hypothetical protein
VSYSNTDLGAAISSGSFLTLGMIVAPCSVKSMSEIASGVTSSLLARAADVVLKERRRLVLWSVRALPGATSVVGRCDPGYVDTRNRAGVPMVGKWGCIPRSAQCRAVLDHFADIGGSVWRVRVSMRCRCRS